MRCARGTLAVLAAVALGAALSSCERERRPLPEGPPAVVEGVRVSELQAGASVPRRPVRNPFEGDPHAIAEGRRLYNWYNCNGCHFEGGGGMGPPFIDGPWLYGSEPQNIIASIVQGRPNGMPAYGGRIPERQLWQITAYIQTMIEGPPRRFAEGARRVPLQTEAGKE